jgi:hypothetical protein
VGDIRDRMLQEKAKILTHKRQEVTGESKENGNIRDRK